jgi:hypothetical protein
MKKNLLFFILIIFSISDFSQGLGGNITYQFLNSYANARIAALGGSAIASHDSDLNIAFQNPSMLMPQMNNQLSYNYVKMFADIGSGYAGFAKHFDSVGTFAAGIQYISYGNFIKTTPDGQIQGTFTAGEYCYHISYARKIKKINYGGSLKLINSNLETYNSFGVAVDLAATYYNPRQLTTFTAVISNLGSQLSTYRQGNYENLPLNVQLGFSKKFAHNPLRISLIAHNLQNLGNNLYQIANRNNRNISLETGLPIQEDFTIAQEVFSHLIVNTEVIFSRTFMFRFGYNYLRRREVGLVDNLGFSGFSWGFGLRVSKFNIAYARANYMINRSTDHFSITTNINDFHKKKNKNEQ